MAVLINNSSGDWATAGTWSTVSATGWAAALATQEAANTTTTTTYAPTTFLSTITTGAITIDALLMKIHAVTATPSGTLSVRLYKTNATAGPVAGTEVTINVADLPTITSPTWVQFKFAAPVTLPGGADTYAPQVVSSVASSVNFSRKSASAGDWTFGLRTTTNQVPTAGDQVLIAGEYSNVGVNAAHVVTMNSTAGVTIGTSTTGQVALEISNKGTLNWANSAASTYNMTLNGSLYVDFGGAIAIGTLASPMPSTSSATVTFNCTTNVQYSAFVRGNGSFTTYGASKTTKAYLAAPSAVAATTLTTDVSTSWASGDILAVASTTRNVLECEQTTMSGAASGTSVPVSALINGHDGSLLSNVAKAEIINLTRNVKIKGVSLTIQTAFVAQNAANVVLGYTEFQFMGSATGNLRGVEFQQNVNTGSTVVTGCAFRNFEVSSSVGIYISSVTPPTTTISNCVFYRQSLSAMLAAANTTPITVTDCWAIAGATMAASSGMNFASQTGTFSNLNMAGSTSSGIIFTGNAIIAPYSVSNIVAHSCTSSNLSIQTTCDLTDTVAIYNNLVSYRSSADGLGLGTTTISTVNNVINGAYLFGNATRGLTLTLAFDVSIQNANIYGEIAYPQTNGVVFNNHSDTVTMENCVIGFPVAHTTADFSDVCPRNQHQITLRNCFLGSSTEVTGQNNFTISCFVASARHEQIAGNQKAYYKYGIITLDNSFYVVAAPSQRITPSSATNKVRSIEKRIAVPNGKQAKVSVWIRKSVAGDGTVYNGSEVRMMLKEDNAIGIASDTLLATTTAAAYGAFEKLTATTQVVTDNGVVRIWLDCDGTTGWINSDLWTVEII